MSNVQDNPPKFDPSDPEKLKISPVFPKKEESEELKYNSIAYKPDHLTQLYLMLLVQEQLETLRQEAKETLELTDTDLFKALEALKSLFYRLMLENTSQDYYFAEALSKNWRIVLEIASLQEQRRAAPKSTALLQTFIHTLNTYPIGTEHTIGYYLSNYTGEKWIPFPFMDILLSLHENALLKKSRSTLNIWILAISSIIEEQKR